MAQTWVLPSQICHSRRGGEIRDKSVEREKMQLKQEIRSYGYYR